jgi:hypothetical protein
MSSQALSQGIIEERKSEKIINNNKRKSITEVKKKKLRAWSGQEGNGRVNQRIDGTHTTRAAEEWLLRSQKGKKNSFGACNN